MLRDQRPGIAGGSRDGHTNEGVRMRVFIVIILVAAAAAAGWFIGKRGKSSGPGNSGGRKVAYYQSAMHPWIKSDKPGNCTICGMKLTPVYEGEKGFETDSSIV